jgi:hypothetical protein
MRETLSSNATRRPGEGPFPGASRRPDGKDFSLEASAISTVPTLAVAIAFLLAIFPVAVFSEDGAAGPEIAGSIRAEGGPLGLRDEIPDEAAADWFASFSGTARVSQTADAARFRAALWAGYDAVSGDKEVSLDEAWAELTPTGYVAARIGRFGVQFGPCIAFNPANALATKDPFDDRANKVGEDGVSLTAYPLRFPGLNEGTASLAVTGAILLPGEASAHSRNEAESSPRDLDKATAHGEIILFLPALAQTEIGIAGNLRRLDGSTGGDDGSGTNTESARDAGAWISADLAGFVIGLEGTVRSEEWGGAASVNRRMGDWLAVAEGSYMSGRDSAQGFLRLAWIGENAEVSLSALGDLERESARTAIEASRNVTDFLVLEAKASWNYRPERWTTGLPEEYAALVAVEYFF